MIAMEGKSITAAEAMAAMRKVMADLSLEGYSCPPYEVQSTRRNA